MKPFSLFEEGFCIIKEAYTQVEKILKLENVDLLSFMGINDNNIKPIEERFTSNVTVRGDNIFVQGVEEEVSAIEKVVKEMIFVLTLPASCRQTMSIQL